MRSLKSFFSLLVVVTLSLTIAVGCNPFNDGSTAYLTKKMNEIPIEFDGYELIECEPLKETIYNFQGVVEFKDSTMDIQYGYEIDGKYFNDYRIDYQGKTLYVNDEFMRSHSETYVKINNIWSDFKNGDTVNYPSRIMAVYPFDNLLFIVTDGIKNRLQRINCRGCIPITLYTLDWDSEKVYYAGYYQDYKEPDVPVVIIKKVED